MALRCEAAAYSHIGGRRNNEDNFFMNGVHIQREMLNMGGKCEAEFRDGTQIYAVCDGMGGALFGEAVVIMNEKYKKDFRYLIKRHGGMFAKGRLLGLQFDTLFTDNLYFEITKKAVENALRIRKAFEAKGIQFFGNSMTNQQFPILTDEQISYLSKNSLPEFWCNAEDGKKVVRFCTSWATTKEGVDTLVSDIENMNE